MDQFTDGYLEFTELSSEVQQALAIICHNIAAKAIEANDFEMPLVTGVWRQMVIDMVREIEEYEKGN